MFTFTTLIGASGTLIASGLVNQILLRKGKEDLASTLHSLTYLGAYGYGLYMAYKVIRLASSLFLGM